MKLSLKWLNEFVNVEEFYQKPEQLADLLTAAGLEVEEIQNKSKDLNNVVVGLILEKSAHPDADKLSVCKVTTGDGVIHQIVCGAKNHKSGDKVIAALPGAMLPGNFEIKKAVLRGVESAGMLCSYKELGIDKESSGIVILDPGALIGQTAAAYFGLDDVVLELKVTPNRADCLSHLGLAREVSTLLNRPINFKISEPVLKSESTQSKIKVEVKNKDMCPRYTGRYIQNIKVSESPDWLKQKIQSVGMNSINNIVDATNYVMMELGQPLHAFDADQLKGSMIVVDSAKPKESFVTLDGSKLNLTGEELMIQDQAGGVCIAGVLGGKNSGVSPQTTNIFLESAFFTPGSARKSLRRHGLNTDSGYRFSRGVDPTNTLMALNRATELILKVAGGEALSGHYDINSLDLKKSAIKLSESEISRKMGYPVDGSKVEEIFKRLHCQISKAGDGYEITAPDYRFDIETDMDLIEEFARIYGYQHIPETLPALSREPAHHNEEYLFHREIRNTVRTFGFSESLNFCFTSESRQAGFLQNLEHLIEAGLPSVKNPVKLVNPLNEEQNLMRSCLSYGLWQNCSYNFHQSHASGRLFEIGKVFCRETEIKETFNLAMIIWGEDIDLWSKTVAPPVLSLKAPLEKLGYQIQNFEKSKVPEFLHTGQSAQIKEGDKNVGFIGTLHPKILNDAKVRVPVAICELELRLNKKTSGKFQGFAKFPVVERDLALLMKSNQSSDQVLALIKQEASGLLQEVFVFDQYLGENLPKGFKSLTIRMKLQDKNGTLQDSQVSQLQEKVLAALKSKLNISVR